MRFLDVAAIILLKVWKYGFIPIVDFLRQTILVDVLDFAVNHLIWVKWIFRFTHRLSCLDHQFHVYVEKFVQLWVLLKQSIELCHSCYSLNCIGIWIRCVLPNFSLNSCYLWGVKQNYWVVSLSVKILAEKDIHFINQQHSFLIFYFSETALTLLCQKLHC